MNYDWQNLRWTCPHCGGHALTIVMASQHINRKHADCDSCDAEAMLLYALKDGIGQAFLSPIRTKHFPRRV